MLHHDHTHHHHHHGPDDRHQTHEARPAWSLPIRLGSAGLLVLFALAATCLDVVRRGEAVVVTRFGDPVRVVTEPGLTFKAPAPLETIVRVDLRLHSLTSGLQDVGTKDGLRVIEQAYVLWRVGDRPEQIRRFLMAVRNEPDTASAQIRSFAASTLETATSRFELSTLVNTDRGKARLADLEALIRDRLQAEVEPTYGIVVEQVGMERLTLPTEALAATVARMSAERLTVAQQRKADGDRAAAEIRSAADRDSRISLADAKTRAAEVEAKARLAASEIYEASYRTNPSLYALLRSLDALDEIVGANTRMVLRTDAAPFRALVEKLPDASPPSESPPESPKLPGEALTEQRP